MNKSYLLVICLLISSFTGCIETEDSDLEPVENVEEIKDDTNNTVDETNNTIDDTNNTVYDTNNTVDDTNNTVDETNNTVDETNNTEDNNPIYFQPETRDELKTAVDEWIANSADAKSTNGHINP